MAFAGSEHVMTLIERLIKKIWNDLYPNSVDKDRPFLQMTYHDAMLKVPRGGSS